MKNLTPHAVTVICRDGRKMTFPPSGEVLRLTEVDQGGNEPKSHLMIGDGLDIPVFRRAHLISFSNLPRESAIVSLPVLQALAADGHYPGWLWAPDTGRGAVRDDRGQIVATRALLQLYPSTDAQRKAKATHDRWLVEQDGPGGDDIRWTQRGGPFDTEIEAAALAEKLGAEGDTYPVCVTLVEDGVRHLPGYGWLKGRRVNYGFGPTLTLNTGEVEP